MISNQSRAKNSISLYMRTRNKQTNIKNKNHADNAGWLTALKSKSHVDLLIFFIFQYETRVINSRAKLNRVRLEFCYLTVGKKIEANCEVWRKVQWNVLHTSRHQYIYIHVSLCWRSYQTLHLWTWYNALLRSRPADMVSLYGSSASGRKKKKVSNYTDTLLLRCLLMLIRRAAHITHQ